MNDLKKITALVCTFVLIFFSKPALAEWEPEGSLETSFVSSVIIPIFLSLQLKENIEESKPENRRYRQEEKERHGVRRRKLQANIPDMLVKEIHYDENNGKWQMRLEDPNNPENYAILTKHFWPNNRPEKEANPIVYLQEGERVVFEKGEKITSGWLLYDDTGKKIGYAVPDDVQLENYSTPF